MSKHHIRFFLNRDGRLYIEDMSPLEMAILNKLGIHFHDPSIEETMDSGEPQYVFLKNIRLPSHLPENTEDLVKLHNHVLENREDYLKRSLNSGTSLFHLKKRIFQARLKDCNLCGFLCGGQRARKGLCPISRKSLYHQDFIHLAEEKEIGKTLAIELLGCNIRCRFCQKGNLITQASGKPFNRTVWKDIRREYQDYSFNNISFLGGNPDQSILGVIDFLSHSPGWVASLPIVWHTNAYSTPDLYNLLKGFVDLWVVDFKYFNDNCALLLSGVPNYVHTAKEALSTICAISKDTPVIVRHLILPAHWGCCQKPLIEWLSNKRQDLIFHPLPQYRPLWKVTEKDGELYRPITKEEFLQVKTHAHQAGLALTESLYWEDLESGRSTCPTSFSEIVGEVQ